MAFIGIGNELNGDDAVGAAVVRALARRLANRPHFLCLVGGTAPENTTGALRPFLPDWVLLIDAVDAGREPGEILWADWRAADGLSASTHTLPPTLLARYLTGEFGCGVGLLGVQPYAIAFGQAMSPIVRRAARRLADGLARFFIH